MLDPHCLPIIQPRFGIQFTRTSARLSYVLLLDVANFSACERRQNSDRMCHLAERETTDRPRNSRPEKKIKGK